MRIKLWILGWFVTVVSVLILIGRFVYKVDPYFHYHKPDTSSYYYDIDNQRYQNDGISKHFEYDALITGTSMTDNFRTSELDERFGTNSVKVSYNGGSYKEINDNLKIALKNNSNLKLVVRGLDTVYFFDSPEYMNEGLVYPTYLYDTNPFNDVYYLFNKDVIFSRAYAMLQASDVEGFKAGILSFDDCYSFQSGATFGINTVLPDGMFNIERVNPIHLSEEDKKVIFDLITQNVTSVADEYPKTEFYYFFPPHSIPEYGLLVGSGKIYRQIEAEKYIIELILEHENIKLFSFNNNADIVTNLNNYMDAPHYASWINSYILKCMYDDSNRLTKENYLEYLNDELNLYINFDYKSLDNQIDYPNDLYQAALMNEAIWDVQPIDILGEYSDYIELSNAVLIGDQHGGKAGIGFVGRTHSEQALEKSADDYMSSTEYIGAKIKIEDIGKHNYLVFYGRNVQDYLQPTVDVFDEEGSKVGGVSAENYDLYTDWQQYIVDLSKVEGSITLCFNGGYTDSMDNGELEYIFSDIILY